MSIAIYRILGNELPPRDTPGARIAALQTLLYLEPKFPRISRVWVLNGIVHQDLFEEYKRLLVPLHDRLIFIPPNLGTPGLPLADRVRQIININGARNLCLADGRDNYDWTVLLDGDCFFSPGSFAPARQAMELRNRTYLHISMPTYRLQPGQHADLATGQIAEPMLAFHRDSGLLFDERLAFGQGDKQELLFRLGHSTVANHVHDLARPQDCVQAGHCYHIATGEALAETDVGHRCRLREESLRRLVDTCDEIIKWQRSSSTPPSPAAGINHGK